MRVLLFVFLLILSGCGGGYYATEAPHNTYRPLYKMESGNEVWVNEMRSRPDKEPNYMDYQTGDIYYPMDDNLYMDSKGNYYYGY